MVLRHVIRLSDIAEARRAEEAAAKASGKGKKKGAKKGKAKKQYPPIDLQSTVLEVFKVCLLLSACDCHKTV